MNLNPMAEAFLGFLRTQGNVSHHSLSEFDGSCSCGEWAYEDEPIIGDEDPDIMELFERHKLRLTGEWPIEGELGV